MHVELKNIGFVLGWANSHSFRFTVSMLLKTKKFNETNLEVTLNNLTVCKIYVGLPTNLKTDDSP